MISHNGHRRDIREAQSRSLQLSEASRILASLVEVVPAPARAHARTFSYQNFLDLQFLKMVDCFVFPFIGIFCAQLGFFWAGISFRQMLDGIAPASVLA